MHERARMNKVAVIAKQAPGYYRYKVGSVEVTVVTDGANVTPLSANYINNATKDEVSAALKAAYLEADKLTTPYSPVLVKRAPSWC
jgi:hypothetical protein